MATNFDRRTKLTRDQYLAEIYRILELDPSQEKSQKIADLTLANGRQALRAHQDDLSSETFRNQIESNDGELMVCLGNYVECRWYENTPSWFQEYLRQQRTDSSDIYNQVLNRSVEYGSKFIKSHLILSLTIQFLFKLSDDAMLQTNTFDDIWKVLIINGRQGIKMREDDLSGRVLKEQLETPDSILFLALRDFYAESVTKLLKSPQVNIGEEEVIGIVLDCVTEYGWWKGMHDPKVEDEIAKKKRIIIEQELLEYFRREDLPMPSDVSTTPAQKPTDAPTTLSPDVSLLSSMTSICPPPLGNKTSTIHIEVVSSSVDSPPAPLPPTPVDSAKSLTKVNRRNKECERIQRCILHNHLTLAHLVTAGEMKYMKKSLNDVLKEITDDYRRTPDFSSFIRACLIPVMYLLKRHQNLDDFMDGLLQQYNHLEPTLTKHLLSLRMLIDVLLLNSNFSTSRKLMILLSKRNPVPFLQPHLTDESSFRFVSDIIHVWDFKLPIILSFGIGPCEGKSTLLNSLLLCSFETSLPSMYFCNTIDIDFGYNFLPRRSMNIADAHGSMTKSLLKKIHSLFDGFILHVTYQYLSNNFTEVIDQLDVVDEPGKYRLLWVRDTPTGTNGDHLIVRLNNHASSVGISMIFSQTMSQDQVRTYSKVFTFFLPDMRNYNDRSVKTQQTTLRNQILNELTHTSHSDKDSISRDLNKLMDEKYKSQLDKVNGTIQRLSDKLIEAARDKNQVKKCFPEYCGFVELCEYQLISARFNFYGSESDREVYAARHKIHQLDETLKKPSSSRSAIFQLFFDILESSDMITCLELLSTQLKEEQQKVVATGDLAMKLPIEKSLSLEVLWRNAIVCSYHLDENVQQSLHRHYATYIKAGFPFEIVDGDNFYFQHKFLSKSLASFQDSKMLVISIIGPQNLGKSTLLNYMFGTLFDVRDGRCTRGIYGSFVKANRPDYDDVLLIDTEGLLSIEREDKEYDRRIVLFCLAVSHIVIVNMSGEFSTTLQDMLNLCASSLKELGVKTIPRPIVHFVLNQRADLNINNHRATVRKVIADLEHNDLKEWIDIREQTFHALPSAFKKEGQTLTSNTKLGNVVKTAPEFIEAVQQLLSRILDPDEESLKRKLEITNPIQWLESSFTVFDTVRKFPDLTYYQDISERRIDNQLQEKARDYLMTTFSGDFRNTLIVESMNKNEETVKEIFDVRQRHMQKSAEVEMEAWFKLLKTPETLRKRTRDFVRTQIIQMFDAAFIETMAANERERIRLLVRNGEGDLKQLIEETVRSGNQMSAQDAKNEFKTMYMRTIESIETRYVPTERLQQAMRHIYTNYNIYEKDFRFEYQQLISFQDLLKTMNETKLQINELKVEFISRFTEFGYENPSINVLPFNPSGTTIYSEEIIQNLRFLNRELIRERFLRFFSRMTSQHHREGKNFIRRGFDSTQGGFSNSQKNEGSRQVPAVQFTDEFQAEIREAIKANSSVKPEKTIYGYNENCVYLPVSRLISEVIKRISKTMDGAHDKVIREIRPELIQKIVGQISSLIIEVKNELAPFCLELSRSLKSVLHTCAIIFLTKYYYDGQMNHFRDSLNELRRREQDLQNYFINVVVPNSSSDEKVALSLIQQLRDCLAKKFANEGQQIIDGILKQYQHINRKWIQDKCDGLLLTKDDIQWNLDYIANPNKIIEQYFRELWVNIEKGINQQLTEKKSQYLAIAENFFFCVEGMLETTKKLGAANTFVNDIFLPNANNSLDANQKLAKKQKCMTLFFQQYIFKSSVADQICVDNQVYDLRQDGGEAFKTLMQRRAPHRDLSKIMADLNGALTKISIGNFTAFLMRLIEDKDKVIQEINQYKSDFKSIDRQDTYATLLDKVRGCTELSPCCKRPCDVDHTRIKSKPGAEFNEHRCLTGHSLRGMNGYKMEETDEASLFMCEQIKDDQEIVIGPTRYRWSQFKKDHSEWKFESSLDEDQLGKLHGKYLTIWARIGPKLCEQHGMKFVTRNETLIKKPQPFHYILLLDSSLSMASHGTWDNLMKAVNEFLQRRHALAMNDRFTIIPFSDTAKTVYENEELAKINTATLGRPKGNTSFKAAFQCVIDTIKKYSESHQSDPIHKNIAILFMSDGEAEYPEKELDKLQKKYGSVIQRFWTIALCDEASPHKTIFEQINIKMNGSFYNVNSATDLVKTYAEVASVMH